MINAIMHAAAVAWVQQVTQSLSTADWWLYPNFTGALQKPLCNYTYVALRLWDSHEGCHKYARVAYSKTLLPGLQVGPTIHNVTDMSCPRPSDGRDVINVPEKGFGGK